MDFLPGERELCSQLQVSRPTLRVAVRLLAKEGILDVQGRRRTRILQPVRQRGGHNKNDGRPVVLLSGEPLQERAVSSIQFIAQLQQTLLQNDRSFIIIDDARLRVKDPCGYLETAVRKYQASCYVLLSSSEPVQLFFSQRSLPAVVCGSRFEGIKLASCDWDYAAIGRHAAGVFLRAGHKNLCVIRPAVYRKGIVQGEEGFCAAAKSGGATVEIVAKRGHALQLHAAVKRIFSRRGHPTGIFAIDPYDGITAVFALQSLGKKIPESVSLISLDWADVFRVLPFEMACYRDQGRLAGKRIRLVCKMVATGVLPPRENLVMAEFCSGESVRSLKGVL